MRAEHLEVDVDAQQGRDFLFVGESRPRTRRRRGTSFRAPQMRPGRMLDVNDQRQLPQSSAGTAARTASEPVTYIPWSTNA